MFGKNGSTAVLDYIFEDYNIQYCENRMLVCSKTNNLVAELPITCNSDF